MDTPPLVPPLPPQSNDPPAVELSFREKDSRDHIKQADIPKYNGGKTKEAETCVLDFTKYCRLIRITEDDHILTAFAIAMTDKDAMWWEYAERSLPHPVRW